MAGPENATASENEVLRSLLVRAAEEADPEAVFLSRRERERSARVDGEATSAARKAAHLFGVACRRHPALAKIERFGALEAPRWPLLIVALVSGVLLDELGGARRVNLLAAPLLGIVAWNAVAISASLGRRVAASRARTPHRWLGSAAAAARGWFAAAAARGGGGEETKWLAATAARFARETRRVFGPRRWARLETTLHLGAALVAIGFVAGMYVRGIAFEYRATWESTFFGTPAVHRLLSVTLAPASHLTGIAVPDREGLAALRAPNDGPAAPWIHLWGATVLVGVVVPRAALAATAAFRARRLRRELFARFDIEPAEGEGAGRSVEIFCYGHEPSSAIRERALEAALSIFGGGASVAFRHSLAYGAEAPEGSSDALLVFSLAQTPEHEVHGELVASMQERRGAGGGRVAVALDADAYDRVARSRRDRLDERIRAWRRILDEAGVEPVVLSSAEVADRLAEARP